MQKRIFYSIFFGFLALCVAGSMLSCRSAPAPERTARAESPEGDYLGQPPPGMTPELFAPGLVSTGRDELNSVFSPTGDELVFSVKTPDRQRHTMLLMTRRGGRWSSAEVLPFSGRYSDADPAFSPDGSRLFFISRRPPEGRGEPREDWDIWVVDRSGDGWGEPASLGAPVNTDQLEVYPSLAADGTLYFSSGRPGGYGKNDLYRSRPTEDGWSEPENLGGAINTEQSEGDLYVAPDQSYIVFVSSGRDDSIGAGDLYVSFRAPDGSWGEGINLGETINSTWTEYCPTVSPDGRHLFFTSYRVLRDEPSAEPLTLEQIERAYGSPQSGMGDIYWVDAAILDPLRNRN